jgi:Cu/Ag efflux protein CusF
VKQFLIVATAVAMATTAWAQAEMTAGEVTKLDKPGARISLKHSGIKSLDMPPMTMNFRAADARLLDGVNVGDRVRFAADKVNGQFTVTVLIKAP